MILLLGQLAVQFIQLLAEGRVVLRLPVGLGAPLLVAGIVLVIVEKLAGSRSGQIA